MDSNQPLDQPLIEPENINPADHLAEPWQRFVNMIVDVIGYYFLAFVFGVIYAIFSGTEHISKGLSYLLAFLAFFFYFFCFENYFRKTPGKLITRTHVVTEKGRAPASMDILARTFCRMIPFEPFSFLGNEPTGWHDTISKTRVIKDRKKV